MTLSRTSFPRSNPHCPQLRGRLLANEPLAPLTWFRVGGPAQALFMPEDENDLAYLLRQPAARCFRHCRSVSARI